MILQESVNVSQSKIIKKEKESSSLKVLIVDQTLALDTEVEYKNQNGDTIFLGKIKSLFEKANDPQTGKKVYEVTIYDYGYNLKEGNVNKIYTDEELEDIIQDVVESNGLTFVNQFGTSGLTLRKTYRDLHPIEIVNELCDVLGASWRVSNTTFYLYKSGSQMSEISIGEDWTTDGWVDDTDKKVSKVIVKGAKISQRTREVLTGTGTEFYTTRIPEDLFIEGLTQTTSSIDGDYSVDKQNLKITFNEEQTDPEVEYSYTSEIRVEIPAGDVTGVVRELKKSYITEKTEARKLGRKYYEIYKDGISSAELSTNNYQTDITKLSPGNKIQVFSKLNSERNGEYLISAVERNYPKNIKVRVGEDTLSIYDWQSESKDRLKQLERTDDNFDFLSLDCFDTGKTKIRITANFTKLFSVINDGDVLWASDTELENGADLISNDDDIDPIPLAYNDEDLPSKNVIDYLN